MGHPSKFYPPRFHCILYQVLLLCSQIAQSMIALSFICYILGRCSSLACECIGHPKVKQQPNLMAKQLISMRKAQSIVQSIVHRPGFVKVVVQSSQPYRFFCNSYGNSPLDTEMSPTMRRTILSTYLLSVAPCNLLLRP